MEIKVSAMDVANGSLNVFRELFTGFEKALSSSSRLGIWDPVEEVAISGCGDQQN